MRTARPIAALAATALAAIALVGCGASTPPVNTPAATESAEAAATESPTPTPTPTPTEETPSEGSREAPLALGETRGLAEGSAWIVGITEANYDAFTAIRAENEYVAAPPEGMRFITGVVSIGIVEENLVSQSVDIANDGVEPWFSITTEYVGSDGKSYGESGTGDAYCYTSNDLASQGPIYDASVVTTGNVCMVVPEAALAGGIWRISNQVNEAVWIEGAP
ncbi:hypothetical protein [Agrococcus beijingensis]|uniref:hypothetical protein n=1 Tax=Agrococcus beijingensis TaxID=3068634 RepID=UPI002740A1FF|nr:hypothetical protein [Agrococcus sp. REN33]